MKNSGISAAMAIEELKHLSIAGKIEIDSLTRNQEENFPAVFCNSSDEKMNNLYREFKEAKKNGGIPNEIEGMPNSFKLGYLYGRKDQ